MTLSFHNQPTAALPEIAGQIVRELAKSPAFCVFLEAEIGAGKTTLVGYILHALGLPESQPVTSPTYTYLNEYKIAGKWYAHVDLYRAKPGLNIEDLGLLDAREFSGMFIEWPGQVAAHEGMKPTHRLKISFSKNRDLRSYEFS